MSAKEEWFGAMLGSVGCCEVVEDKRELLADQPIKGVSAYPRESRLAAVNDFAVSVGMKSGSHTDKASSRAGAAKTEIGVTEAEGAFAKPNWFQAPGSDHVGWAFSETRHSMIDALEDVTGLDIDGDGRKVGSEALTQASFQIVWDGKTNGCLPVSVTV